ncbi:MAG: hypothetical protein AMXMBFR51_21020 [Ignavibacteriota bacterium]
MFTLEEIQNLLSRQAFSLLSTDNNLYNEFARQVTEIIKSKVSFDLNQPPQWLIQPFVWILEYLLLTKFSGQSAETIQMVKDRFDKAIILLDDYRHNYPLSSNIGKIDDAYEIY